MRTALRVSVEGLTPTFPQFYECPARKPADHERPDEVRHSILAEWDDTKQIARYKKHKTRGSAGSQAGQQTNCDEAKHGTAKGIPDPLSPKLHAFVNRNEG